MDPVKIDGVTLLLAGQPYVVPPLTLKQMKRLLPKLKGLQAVDVVNQPDQMDIIAEVAHAALARNYPDLTVEAVEDLLDIENIQLVIPAIMGASGLVRQKLGEAAAGSRRSTGAASTDISPPPPAGPSATSTT